MEGDGDGAAPSSAPQVVVEDNKPVADRIAYLKAHMTDDAPKVGASATNSAAMSSAAGQAQASVQRNQEPVASAGENDVWQSAMERYEHESWDAAGYAEDGQHKVQNQEERDLEFARQMAGMDRMGAVEIEYDQPPPEDARGELPMPNESTEKLTLWGTFKLLYKRNPMVKYYLLGLAILLAATGAIIGVSLSNANKSSSKDCAAASYTDEAFVLLPQESQNVRVGGFGSSLSASSEYLVVGAPDTACNLFTQGSSCESTTIGGAAYLYKRNSKNEWSLTSSFVLDDGVSAGDQFGQAVAVSEDSTTVVVGAPGDDKLGTVAGAIYIMEQPFSSTTPPIRLVSNDLGADDEFGGSVSAASTTLGTNSPIRVTNVVAGASYDDDSGSRSGGVYVFTLFDADPPATACGGDMNIEVGKWTQCQKLLPDDGESNDLFGRTVDVADRTLVVGAMWDDNERGIDSGAAYVYYLDDGGSWSFQEKLISTKFDSAQSDRFGVSVATSGDVIVVGADLDDSGQDDAGAAYVFRLINRAWKIESMLVPTSSSNRRGYECGYSVDISSDGRTIIVGCPGAPEGGVALVYELQGDGKWLQVKELGYSAADLRLGHSVASSGTDGTAVLGYGKSSGEVLSFKKDC